MSENFFETLKKIVEKCSSFFFSEAFRILTRPSESHLNHFPFQNMDIQPFLSLLRPENMQSMAQLATELSSMASKNMRDNEKDVQ